MKISKRSVPSNIEKALNEVPRGLQLADSLQHMDLELIAEINRAYDEAVRNGFKGSLDDYIKTTPIEELKRIELEMGGSSSKPKVKKDVPVKRIDLTKEFLKTADYLSRLTPTERETVNFLLRKMMGKE